jgi:hypothetical protein
MARQEFLRNLRTARNLFLHGQLPREAVWLTPNSVKGFNGGDFAELGFDRQNELRAAVREFLEIARQVPPTDSATAEQFATGKVAFSKMLAILEPYVPVTTEGQQIEEALKRVDLPPWVLNWNYEFRDDADGSPAVWVDFVLDQDAMPRSELGLFASKATAKILEALPALGNTRWPFVRVRTAAEHRAL